MAEAHACPITRRCKTILVVKVTAPRLVRLLDYPSATICSTASRSICKCYLIRPRSEQWHRRTSKKHRQMIYCFMIAVILLCGFLPCISSISGTFVCACPAVFYPKPTRLLGPDAKTNSSRSRYPRQVRHDVNA